MDEGQRTGRHRGNLTHSQVQPAVPRPVASQLDVSPQSYTCIRICDDTLVLGAVSLQRLPRWYCRALRGHGSRQRNPFSECHTT